jgi:hypothetical protein
VLAGQHTSTESIGVFPVATQYGPTIGDVPKAGPSLANPGPGGGPNGSAGNNGITEATTQFFGTPTRGQRIVYVIDRSASMGENGRLDVARQELMASLCRLPANAFFQVIVYNSTDEILVGNAEMLVPASPENIAHVDHALATLEPVGGTRHLTAITVALRMRPDVVYFLTDADDLSKTDQTSIQRLNADHAIFHTIELTRVHCGQPGMPMQVLASSTGGTYRALDVPPLR